MIIGLMGAKGAGKSTVAQMLVERGFVRAPFAGPLKAMLRELGLSGEQLDGAAKERESDLLCGRTARYAMQTLGTEWGRQIIHPDLWVRAWEYRLTAWPDGVNAVVEDCRFENEVAAIRRQRHGKVWLVRRPSVETMADAHASEQGWREIRPDRMVWNDWTVEALKEQVDGIFRH